MAAPSPDALVLAELEALRQLPAGRACAVPAGLSRWLVNIAEPPTDEAPRPGRWPGWAVGWQPHGDGGGA